MKFAIVSYNISLINIIRETTLKHPQMEKSESELTSNHTGKFNISPELANELKNIKSNQT